MFGLEFLQGKHNGVVTNSGNNSASNDPKQIPNDANELLIKGAQKAAAGRELGMTEEETLAATSRQFRRQSQRAAYRDRNKRLAEWEQKQKTLRDEGFEPMQMDSDVRFDDDMTEEDRVFGRTDYEMGFRTDLDQQDPEPEDEIKGTRRRRGRFGAKIEEDIVDRARPEESPFFKPEVAPKSALTDALSLLQQGTAKYGYDALPGSADAEDRLTRATQGGVDLDRERFLAKLMAEADFQNSDPEMRQYNQFQAAAEAERIARDGYTVNGPGAMADEAIGRIAEIRKLGGAGALAAGESAQVIRYGEQGTMGNATLRNGVYYDPETNNPIAIQGPERAPVNAAGNTPNTQQILNAPGPQSATDWVKANLPSPREGGRVFNDYPQVDIGLQTTNFANKLRELDGYGLQNVSSNIRSVEELQKVVDFVARRSAEMGKPLYTQNEQGRNVRSQNPGTQEVMQLLRMSTGEQQQLANALFQIETSQNPAAYQSREGGPTKGVTFNAPEAMNGNIGQTPIARVPRESAIRVGTSPAGKPIRANIQAQLAQLPTPDASKPFIGQVEGEKPRIDRRKPGGMGDGDQLEAKIEMQARARAKGKPIDEERVRQTQVKARLAEEREKRDRAKREAAQREVAPFRVDVTRRRFT